MSDTLRSVAAAIALLVCASFASAQVMVRTMPGFPHAPNVLPEQRHPARPGVPFIVWGNVGAANGSLNGATYTWSFSSGPNLQVVSDGNLSGTVTNDRFIFEEVTFNLLGGATRGDVVATLTVDDGMGNVGSQVVEIRVVDPSDPISDTPLENQAFEANIAIQDGMRWLYLQQQADGRFASTAYASQVVGVSGFVLWAFQNQGHLARNADTDIYRATVEKGLERMLQNATLLTNSDASYNAPRADVLAGATAAGVSDLNSNQRQVRFSSGSDQGYEQGIALAALVASTEPTRVVASGPLAGLSFLQIAEDAIDWIGGTQAQGNGSGGSGQGGWTYVPSSSNTRSDMSINSWMYVGMEGAEAVFGIDVPGWIKRECEYTLASQQANNTAAPYGYTGTGPLQGAPHGQATTGGGLSGLALLQLGGTGYTPGLIIGGGAAPLNNLEARRDSALAYLGNTWGVTASANSLGFANRGNYYAMWSVARALRLSADARGVSKIDLTNNGVTFDWETGEENGSGIPAPSGTDREGYVAWLVDNQEDPQEGGVSNVFDRGRWNTGNFVGSTLSSAMSVLILTPRVFSVANNPPVLRVEVAGVPQNCPVRIGASEGVAIRFDVTGFDQDANETLTLSATGIPPGATFTPTLPTSGASPVSASFLWSPNASQVGRFHIDLTLTDSGSPALTATCRVTIDVGVCLLAVGSQQMSLPLAPGVDFGVLPELIWPVTMEDRPWLRVPSDPSLFGRDFYFQVFMNNPFVFPNRPLQVSPVMNIRVGDPNPTFMGQGFIDIGYEGTTAPGGMFRVTFDVFANN